MDKQKAANPYNEILFGPENEHIPKFPPRLLSWSSSETVYSTPSLTGWWVDLLYTEQGQSAEGQEKGQSNSKIED